MNLRRMVLAAAVLTAFLTIGLVGVVVGPVSGMSWAGTVSPTISLLPTPPAMRSQDCPSFWLIKTPVPRKPA